MSEKPSWTKWMVEAAASTARARAITERSSSRREDRSSQAGRPFETGRRVKTVPTEKSTSRYIARRYNRVRMAVTRREAGAASPVDYETLADRKSTRLNSSHVAISYAVFCLKKKKKLDNKKNLEISNERLINRH